LVAGPRLLGSVASSAPWLAPFVGPITVLVFGFILLTWVASPLFNFLLRFNKFGRLALTAEEKRESSWIGCFTVIALAFTLVYLGNGAKIGRAFFGMRVFGLMLFPLRVTFLVDAGRPRQIAALVSLGLFLINVPLLFMLFGNMRVLNMFSPNGLNLVQEVKQVSELFLYGQMGMVLSSWLPMILRSRNSFR
jgi:hypothetical protein